MPFCDLREYIETLERYGELQRLREEVDWNLEFGAITRRCCEVGAPAVFAERVKDYPAGYRLFGVPFGGSIIDGRKLPYRRLAIAMGLPPETSYVDLVQEYIRRINNPIKPRIVSTGPCKENVHLGRDVDLFEFPAPMVHWGDGGRYLNTWGVTITKDPDGDWVNWGVYRAMIHTRNKMGGLFVPFQHGPRMYYRYEQKGEAMPFAIAMGGDPLLFFAATSYSEIGVDEAEVAGGLRGEAVDVVKCETNDLYVPASAEIVLEGEVRPHERWDEGPFGEYTGYRASPRMARPVYRVNAVTHRNNPILPMSNMGMPVDDSGPQQSVSIGGELLNIFRKKHYPVKMVYHPHFATCNGVVISTEVPFANYAHTLASEVWASKSGAYMHWIIIVEDDVDPTDLQQVFHSMIFKCHPVRGIRKYENIPGSPLDPYLNVHERQFGMGAGVVIDCTWPKDWDPEISLTLPVKFTTLYPQEVQNLVLEKWGPGYGFTRG